MAKAEERRVPIRPLGLDVPRREDDGPWELLWPSAEARLPKASKSKRKRKAKPKLDTNGASVVLRVEDWLLLTGDLPTKAEKELLARGLKPVEVLKVGHHGSRSSTSARFVQRLQPAQALISCGEDNRYGHPSAQALKSLRGRRLWRTDLQGCVFVRKRRGEPARLEPWRPATAEALARPHPRYRSPWRSLKAAQAQAWEGAADDEKEPENEGRSGAAGTGDAA
jgi:hypothetical protein